MTAQLYIRPDRLDTRVIGDLLSPGGGPRLLEGRPTVAGLIVDATIAESRPEFVEAAAASGIPALIDPWTFALQVEPSSTSPFAALPYAQAATSRPDEIDLDAITDAVVDLQLSNGATGIVLPYFHVKKLGDGWASTALRALSLSTERCETRQLGLGTVAVLSGNRQTLSRDDGLAYVDRFVSIALDGGVRQLALCVSPAGAPHDSYVGVAKLAAIVERVNQSGLPVVVWHQGAYGLAIAALGAAGYESGIGQGESTDMSSMQNRVRRHKRRSEEGDFQRPRRAVYMPLFGRSVPRTAAEALLRAPEVQGELVCEIPGCCPTIDHTLDRQRHHAVRARAHQLAQLAGRPIQWRLNSVLRSTETALGVAKRANEVLRRSDDTYQVPVSNLQAQVDYLCYRLETEAA